MAYGKDLTKYAGSCGRYRGFYGNSLLDYSYPVMNGGGGGGTLIPREGYISYSMAQLYFFSLGLKLKGLLVIV